MKGAIFYSGKYGSTEQYADWIGEATGLPVFDIKDPGADLSGFDLVVLGSSVVYFKLTMRKWAQENLSLLKGRARILFSVSGAGPSDRLDRWVSKSFPPELLSQTRHIALRGKLDHSKVSWWIRCILWVASVFNPNQEASKDERYGFDYMDKDTTAPIVEMIRKMQLTESSV